MTPIREGGTGKKTFNNPLTYRNKEVSWNKISEEDIYNNKER